MKLKIRKIELPVEEIFNRIEKLLEISEKLQNRYWGTSIKELCSSLGIKELEFWELKFDNEDLFNEKFIVRTAPTFKDTKLIFRCATYENLNKQQY